MAPLFAHDLFAEEAPSRGSAAEDHVVGSLVFDRDHKRVGVLFDIVPQWHIYWRNPGESGLETRVKFAHPTGPLKFETPRVYLDPSGTIHTFGFEHQTLMWVDLEEVPETVSVSVSFLTCKVECIPGTLKLSRKTETPSDDEIALFEKYAARAPVSVEATVTQTSPLTSNIEAEIVAVVPCDDCSVPDVTHDYLLIPDVGGVAQWKTKGVEPRDGALVIQLGGHTTPDEIPIVDCAASSLSPSDRYRSMSPSTATKLRRTLVHPTKRSRMTHRNLFSGFSCSGLSAG